MPRQPTRVRDDRLWQGTLVAGLALIAAAALVPRSGLRTGLELGSLSTPVLAIPLGIRRWRPARAGAWKVLWAAFVCFSLGWALLARYPLATGHILLPALPHLAAVPLIAWAVLIISSERGFPRDADSLLDAAIVGAAAAFVGWRALLQPAYVNANVSLPVLATTTVYPALDLLLLVGLLHLTFSSTRRSATWMFLLTGAGIALVGDLVLAVVTASGNHPGPAIPISAVGYLLVGVAALLPSMASVTEPSPPVEQRLGPVRIGLLGGSLLTTPLVIFLDRTHHASGVDSTSLLLPSGVISIVILARMVDLARQAEQARQRERARERRFESLVRNSSDLVSVIDRQGELTYVSPAVESVLGIEQSTATERSLAHWVHPADQSDAQAALMRLSGGGDTTRITLRLRHGDGTWRWMEVHAVNLLGEPGVAGVVLNCRDVTERVAADELILSSNVQQAAVAGLGRDALAGSTVDQLARQAASLVRATLQVSSCVLYFVDAAGNVELTAGEGVPSVEPGPVGPLSAHPLINACLTTTELVQVAVSSSRDPLPDPTRLPQLPLIPTDVSLTGGAREDAAGDTDGATVLAVRISDGHRPFGVLLVRDERIRRFRVDEASFLHSMAGTLGLAIARREVEYDARHQALHDELTGLPNRALFVDRLTRALTRLHDGPTMLAVLFLDVDHFKVVNDSLGHNAGDRILVSVAERLQRLLRPEDTVARFGGDEFTVLCEDLTGVDAALDLAQRVREELSAALTVGRAEIHTTVSVGIALAERPGAQPEAMLRDADAAMYRAKERGRNRVELFDETMRSRAVTRLRTEIALREALVDGQLSLYYQPIVDLSSGQVLAAEALVRWDHPTEGLIMPTQFIPIAEEAGIINALGRWVLTEAVAQASEWYREYGPLTPILGVNVSARSLAAPDFVSDVASILRNADVPPNLVSLEITESALMDDVERSLDVLRQLRELGLTLAIDDFGTGYSSLSYLKRFPIDVLKIDRSFTDGLGREAEDSAIVAAVVNLAHTLDRLSIAEGVETPLQLRELQQLGCPLGQGFLFSPAVPAGDLDILAGYEICQEVAARGERIGPLQPGPAPAVS